MPINTPILLTWLRIVAIPIFVAVYYLPDTWLSPVAKNWTAMGIFSAAAITDWLDGYLARKWGETSAFGAFLDPVADKLMVTSVMVFMVALGRVPAWLVVVLIARDLAITGLRSIASSEGIVIAASRGGKIKTALQLVGLTLLLVHFRYPLLGLGISIDYNSAGLGLLYISLAASLFSGMDYVVVFFRTIGESNTESPPPSA